ncbi:MAG: hypothetical protein GTN40_02135 [Candidatus Aenigmarchaeota archaeon]|nr:hypothetical protein [Candidatus Aenigmarchaeota archaeon]
MKKKEKPKEVKGIGGGSFITAGIVVMLVPAILYIIFGDFTSFLKHCVIPFSSVDIGGFIVTCMELRFIYVLSYFCLFFGLILVIFGLGKKIIETKK